MLRFYDHEGSIPSASTNYFEKIRKIPIVGKIPQIEFGFSICGVPVGIISFHFKKTYIINCFEMIRIETKTQYL